MLVRNRPTPGTPMAKSASFFSANSLTWRGVMTCSASAFTSSGLTGGISSGCSSPLSRIVGDRPTLSSRSDAFRWTIWAMVCLKLNVETAELAAGAGLEGGDSAIGIHSEEDLAELHRLRVVHHDLAHDAGDLGLDFVHDLHRLDDAHRLPRGHAGAHLDVGLRARLGRLVERSHHRRPDILEQRHRPRELAVSGHGRSARRGRG